MDSQGLHIKLHPKFIKCARVYGGGRAVHSTCCVHRGCRLGRRQKGSRDNCHLYNPSDADFMFTEHTKGGAVASLHTQRLDVLRGLCSELGGQAEGPGRAWGPH